MNTREFSLDASPEIGLPFSPHVIILGVHVPSKAEAKAA